MIMFEHTFIDKKLTVYVQGVAWLQTFYMFLAIPLIFVGLLPQVKICIESKLNY